jgi:hypothetical protein
MYNCVKPAKKKSGELDLAISNRRRKGEINLFPATHSLSELGRTTQMAQIPFAVATKVPSSAVNRPSIWARFLPLRMTSPVAIR